MCPGFPDMERVWVPFCEYLDTEHQGSLESLVIEELRESTARVMGVRSVCISWKKVDFPEVVKISFPKGEISMFT